MPKKLSQIDIMRRLSQGAKINVPVDESPKEDKSSNALIECLNDMKSSNARLVEKVASMSSPITVKSPDVSPLIDKVITSNMAVVDAMQEMVKAVSNRPPVKVKFEKDINGQIVGMVACQDGDMK